MPKGERLLYNRLFLVCVDFFCVVLSCCFVCIGILRSRSGGFFVLKSDTMSTENKNVLCPTSVLTSR